MNTERVISIVDNRIKSILMEGVSIPAAVDELRKRSEKFFSILENEDGFNTLAAILEPESVSNTRLRYAAYYVKVASKRIEDLIWMHKNKHRFPRYNSQKLFKLVQLRDKISNTTKSGVTPVRWFFPTTF